MTRAWIGLGSNLADPHRQLDAAVEALAALPDTRVAGRSPRYWTEPVGDPDQPDFLNAVVALDTTMDAAGLLSAMQRIERERGRRRAVDRRWGPRTLDLDLLVFGDAHFESQHLTVPHPRIAERAFVLRPLADLAPDLAVPGRGTVSAMLAAVSCAGVKPAEAPR